MQLNSASKMSDSRGDTSRQQNEQNTQQSSKQEGPEFQISAVMKQFQEKQDVLLKRIEFLERERDTINAKALISAQIEGEKMVDKKTKEGELLEEIQELKDNLDRKEYLLQYNEQKYFQYEKVLRELILNKNTDEAVKDHLRDKIESQELFVPKDERKVSNLVIDNQEK